MGLDDESPMVDASTPADAQPQPAARQVATLRAIRPFATLSPVPVIGVRLDGRVVLWSRAARQLFGWSEAEAMDRPNPAVPEELRGSHQARVAGVASGDTIVDAEVSGVRRDGSRVTLRLSAVPLAEDGGTPLGALWIVHDVTELRRVERELRQSEEHFRTMVTSLGNGIVILDPDERFSFANPAAERLIGVPEGTLTGMSMPDLASPDNVELLRAEARRRRAGEEGTYEIEIIRPDGERRTLLVNATPRFDGEGAFSGTLAVLTDSTDRRRADDALLVQQETLIAQQDQLLAQRAELMQRQQEITRLNRELEITARIDPLTKLGNRLRLNEDLATLAGRLARTAGRAGIVIVDVDYFKRYNDRFGHLAGDEALRSVGGAIRAAIRVGDGAYRYGGEEFVAVLPDVQSGSAEAVAERILAGIRDLAIPHPDNPPRGIVTASAGVAEFLPSSSFVDDCLRAADAALYQAKERGRDRVSMDTDTGTGTGQEPG